MIMRSRCRKLHLEPDQADRIALKELEFDSLEEAAREFAGELGSIIESAIAERGRALIAVSGGNTPRLVFEHLSSLSIDWKRVTITLTDERWVAPSHKDSNELLVRSCLMRNAAETSSFVSLYGGEETPEAGQDACEMRLSDLRLPFDAVYIGIGVDGHIASLFPGAPVADGSRRCLSIPRSGSRVARMSLSLTALLNTRQLMLLYSGAEKHEIYLQAKNDDALPRAPIGHIFGQYCAPVAVFRAP